MSTFKKIIVVAVATAVSSASFAWGWDPIGDLRNPSRIVRNVQREVNRTGPVGRILAAPVTAPLAAIDGCAHDLRTCPQQALNATPYASLVDICARDLKKCPENILKSAPAQLVWPTIWSYRESLFNQARNKWRSLPESFVAAFGHHYPNVDLRAVRFATGIDTVHGQAITFGNRIFYPGGMDLTTRSGIELMLHELEHTSQYERKGGEQAFLSEYLLHGAGQIVACGCVDVHDAIPTERDAIRKSRAIVTDYGWLFRVTNSSERDLRVSVRFREPDRSWTTRTYSYSPGERAFLAAGRNVDRIHTRNRIYYFYAASADGECVWQGTDPAVSWEVDGESRQFRRILAEPDAELFDLALTCDKAQA